MKRQTLDLLHSRHPAARSFPVVLFAGALAMAAAGPLAGQPGERLDKGQGDAARRMIADGDPFRVYCRSCLDVAYSARTADEFELAPQGSGYRLLLNGRVIDPVTVYIDNGYGDGWENLASLLGVGEDHPGPMPKTLDEDVKLYAHAGHYHGKLEGREIVVDLLPRDRSLEGWRVSRGQEFRLSSSKYNASTNGETLSLFERQGRDRIVATYQGKLEAESAAFEGRRIPLGTEPVASQLRRMADYVRLEKTGPGLVVTVVHPRFPPGEHASLNPELEKAARTQLEKLFADFSQSTTRLQVLRVRSEQMIVYDRSGLVSLRRETAETAGGLEGTLTVECDNLRLIEGSAKEIHLKDIFLPQAAYQEHLLQRIRPELERRSRQAVPAKKAPTIAAADLEVFNFSTFGLHFTIGGERVPIPYREFEELLDPDGPLGIFVKN